MGFKRFARHKPISQEDDNMADIKIDPHSQRETTTLQVQDRNLKKKIRFLKLVVRCITFALAIYGVYSQGVVLHKFLTTRNIIRQDRNPWAAETQLWPTILLLTTSAITVIVSLGTIVSYFVGVKAANAASDKFGTPVSVAEFAAHLAIWIATAVAYRVGRTSKDLWGWTCSDRASKIQQVFPEVDFSFFCNSQTGSWYVSIAQVILALGTGVVWYLAWRRSKQQKILKERSTPLLPSNQWDAQTPGSSNMLLSPNNGSSYSPATIPGLSPKFAR